MPTHTPTVGAGNITGRYSFGSTEEDEPGVMTLRRLIKSCEKHALYRTPEVNDKLYCHYEGYREIDGEVMARYANIKCLWLQGNGISEIKGLDGCELLTSLYLHENCINEIGEGLRKLVALDTLNLSKTFVKIVDGLAQCEKLTTLNLGYCSLGPGADSIAHCESLPKLATLDIQHNRLEDGEGVLDVATKMPALRVLYCQGNPFVKGFKYYRKRFIGGAAELRYLDDRPVFEDEARRVKAWAAGVEEGGYERGNEAEREMIKTLRDEKRAYDDNRHNDFMKLMHEGQAIRRAREEQAAAAALSAEMAAAGAGTPTDAATAALAEAGAGAGAAAGGASNPFAQLNPISDVLAAKGKPRGILDPPPAPPAGGGATVNPFSGEAIIDVPESASITASRDARRAALDAAGAYPPVPGDDDDAPPALEGADVPPPPPPRRAAGPATDADDADAAWRQELAEEAAEEARWTASAGGHVGADDDDDDALPPTDAEATFALLEENNAGHATFEEAYAAAAADAAAEDAATAGSAGSLPVASPACDDDESLPPVAAVAAPPIAPGSVKAVPVVPGELAQPAAPAAVVLPPPPPPPPSGATDFFELD